MQIMPFKRPTNEKALLALSDKDFFALDAAWRDEMYGRLGKLLLNPNFDRCDITDGILGDRELIKFLSTVENVVLEKVVPPGTTWAEIQQVEFTFGSLLYKYDDKPGEFVMPLMLGSLVDENLRPWFQASPFEFIPAIEGIQTSNLCGKPRFRAEGGAPMSTSSISAKENFSPSIFQCCELC